MLMDQKEGCYNEKNKTIKEIKKYKLKFTIDLKCFQIKTYKKIQILTNKLRLENYDEVISESSVLLKKININ